MKLFSKKPVKVLQFYLLISLLIFSYGYLAAQNIQIHPVIQEVNKTEKTNDDLTGGNPMKRLPIGQSSFTTTSKSLLSNTRDSIGFTQQASIKPKSNQAYILPKQKQLNKKGQLLQATTELTEAIFNINSVSKGADITRLGSKVKETGNVSSTPGWNTIINETFESTFPSIHWDAYANGGYTDVYWNDVNYTSYSGSWSAWCANGGSQGISPVYGSYVNNMDGWMVYGPFDLSDATAGDISFYLKNNSETDYDFFSCMVSINGTNFYGWKTSGSTSGWLNETLDFTDVYTLGNICGKSQVYIALCFTTDASNCNYSGAFVDNLIIKKYVPDVSVNLTPFQPTGWDDKIVLSTVSGTNTSSSTIYDNQTIYLDWALTNSGSAYFAQTFYSKLYIDGVLQNTYSTLSGITPGYYAFVSDAIIGPLSAGTHTFKIEVDANNDILESNETDNVYTRSKTITVSASANLVPFQPTGWDDKIVLSTASGNNTSSSTIYDDQTIYLDWAAINTVNSSISQTFYTKLYIDGILKDTYTTNGLPAGYYTNIEDAIFGPLSAGTHVFKIVVDANNNVSESNENDNEYTRNKIITVNASANLVPFQPTGWDDKIVLSTVSGTNTSASTINNDQTIYLDWALRNAIGSDINQAFTTKLYIDGILKSTYNFSSGLPAYSYGSISDETIGPLSAGTHTFKIVVDADNNISESNESDNEYTRSKTITVINPADINVTPLLLTINQSDAISASAPSYMLVDNSKNNPKVSLSNNQPETFKHALGNIIPDSVVEYWKNHPGKTYAGNFQSLPTSIDWSINDSPVKNQGNCGSCWAFAVTAFIENLGVQNDLSEQDLISCGNAGSCSGGYLSTALKFFQDTGVPDESCYPYSQLDGNCSNACASPSFKEKITTVSTTLWGIASVENIKTKLQEGPLVVCMDVPEDGSFDRYTGGVYNYSGGPIDDSNGHAVLLVGYDDNQQCFKVKNSWGANWGESGYFRIAYDDVTDDVEFGSYAVSGSGVYTENLSNNSFTLSNQGMSTLTVSSITSNKNWVITTGYPSASFSILPSNSQNVSVSINWSLLGSSTETALIIITSNDPDEPQVTVQITAVPRQCTQTPPVIESITQPTCASASGTVYLKGLPASGTWTLTRMPGSITTTGTGISKTITGLQPGTYTFTVTNSVGCTSGPSANITINGQPLSPSAPLIGSITQPTSSTPTGSVVLNGLPSTGTWILTRMPGSITTSGSGISKTISVLQPGTYTYTVTNSAGCVSLPSANIVINSYHSAPIANAGPDQSVTEGTIVSLDGTASTSQSGTSLTYKWTVPAGITLNSSTIARPTFTAPEVSVATNYILSLVVNDGTMNSIEDQVTITVNNSNIIKHFSPVWTGNGIDHMNINLYSVKIDDVEMEAGDEVGIFDGTVCVGAGMLTRNLSSYNTLDIVVSRNDGSGNGYNAGNSITYKIYDKTKDQEFNNISASYSNTNPSWSADGKFSVGATAFAALSCFSKSNQTIILNAGWNIISANLTPENLDLKNIFQPLIDAGKLKKVMDETGKTIEDFGAFGGWKNNIGNLNATKGYKVNVTSSAILSLEGIPLLLPMNISLNSGWNIISYPATVLQDAQAIMQSLINTGKLLKVMDETGKTIENFGSFGGWKNNIGNFVPGKGYKVNMSAAAILTIQANQTKSAGIAPERIVSSHFPTVYQGNGTDHMNIHLVDLASSGIMEGDEIGIFDGSYCVGSATIGIEQLMEGCISIPASAQDDSAPTVSGFIEGNPVSIQLFRNSQRFQLNLQMQNNSKRTFVKGASMFASANLGSITEIIDDVNAVSVICYPNPFTEQLTIDVNLYKDESLSVEIYDLSGKLVRDMYQGKAEKKVRLIWDGKNENGLKMKPGTYILKINSTIEKIILQ